MHTSVCLVALRQDKGAAQPSGSICAGQLSGKSVQTTLHHLTIPCLPLTTRGRPLRGGIVLAALDLATDVSATAVAALRS